MLRKIVQILGGLIPGWLITVVLLTTACGSVVTRPSYEAEALPEPPITPSTETASVEGLGSDPGERIKFEHISLEQGLSQVSISCILQDDKGFMWFGTADGLNKYDGYHFEVYTHNPEDPHSLSDNKVQSIYQDREGVLWIGTWGGGLDKFDRENGQFIHHQNDPHDPHSLSDNRISSIYQDQEGTLWIGTWGGGLNRLAQREAEGPVLGPSTPLRTNSAEGPERENEQFIRYQNVPHDPHSLSDNRISSIYQDREGALWIGTWGGGLDRLVLREVEGPVLSPRSSGPRTEGETEGPERKSVQFVHYQSNPNDPHSLSGNFISSIYQDSSGVLWIGTGDGGLSKFDRETERFVHYQNAPHDPHSLSHNSVSSIYQDREGGVLWIGTGGGGLNRLDRENEQFIRYQDDPLDPHSLSGNRISSFYQDREGTLWIGTAGEGLDKFDRSAERFFHVQNDPDDPNSLSDDHILSVYQDREGMLWIGTMAGGLNRYDRTTGTFTHYPSDPDDPHSLNGDIIVAVYEDRAGRLWIGTEEGLYTFDRDAESFRRWMTRNAVRLIYEDSVGRLWLGTNDGLTRLDQARAMVTNYQHDPDDPHSLGHNYVFSIHQDREGALWIGTWGGGLDKLDLSTGEEERFIHYRNDPRDPQSLSNDFVLAVHQDRSGALWIGTDGGGLDKLDPLANETFVHYRVQDGLPNDTVYGILEDAQGYLWLSTNKGLSRFDPRSETFRNYGVRDGLQSNEFNGGAYHKSSSGEMFFGGINGLNAFYPANVKDNAYVPPVVLTSLTQGGEDVGVGTAVDSLREVTFRWPNDFFEFEFAALSYAQPEKNQYAYRLEGFDREWIYGGTRRFGRYTNLPGGTYTLRMKGSNNDGLWNEEGASVKVTIVPPFWETWWFRGIVVLVLVGSAIGGYRLRVKSIETQTHELEIQVEQRTRELRERTHEIERRRQELEALYRADAELHRYLRLDQVLQALVDIAMDILQADKSSLMVWDEQREKLSVQASHGFRPETLAQMHFAPDEGTAGHVAVTGEPVIVEDARTDSRIAKRLTIIEPEGIRSFMQLPIKIDDAIFGVFSADYTRPYALGDDEQRIFIALAQRAALAIETAQLYEQAQELVVMEERSRLARDLHDAVTQTLFSASLIAEVVPTLWESDRDTGRQLLKELRQLSRGALAEMRTLLLELRPAALVEASLDDLLRQLGETVTGRKGVPVTVTVKGQCALPSNVHVALYRIAQEALNNVVKHAEASQVTVSLHRTPLTQRPLQAEGMPAGQEGNVELCISDDGRGFDPGCVPPDRLGLGIIRERTQAIGARLEIESRPGGGTKVVVTWKRDE